MTQRSKPLSTEDSTLIPVGLCQCGCGCKTQVPTKNDASNGHVKGVPRPFVRGHHTRKAGPRFKNHHRLEDRGYTTPCWIWKGARTPAGYGQRQVRGKRGLAHRWYYIQEHGSIPEDLELDHLCRVRECVNPDHLEAVTHAVNTRRGAKTKLTWQQVEEIRRLAAEGLLSHRALARRFNTSKTNIGSIIHYERWKP